MSKLVVYAGLLVLVAACSTPDSIPPTENAPTDAALEVVEAPLPDVVIETAPAIMEEAVFVVESTPSALPLHTFELRRGETVHHFARWSEQPIERIAELSGLALTGSYSVGTEVVIELNPADRSIVEARRDEHHQTRATNYLASRGSNTTTFYTVKTGDNAWTIARTFEGMPVWLLESMNPSTDLDLLRPGQELMVPVFNDITASVDED